MNKLKKDESVILKKANKGGATVLMDKQQYMDEAIKQLADETVYKKLKNDPTNQFKKEIDSFLQEAYEEVIITSEEKLALTSKNPQSPETLFNSENSRGKKIWKTVL